MNIDVQPLPGVDVVADVTQGLNFRDAEAIYAEHFVEHLRIDQALDFLVAANEALRPGGWIRLSTPNLDWVWETHYRTDAGPEAKLRGALVANRAFHGWGHRFLWNRETLGEALLACGFAEPRWCRWGESKLEVFDGIERHRAHPDTDAHPHVLIAEAERAEPRPARLRDLRALAQRELTRHVEVS